ncbi:MAG: hypothetical protein HQL16_03635 [Candidatus Omnitrophica bacterium]|nr:hypothetical protein [Candidatus Omnitrophota bacterium]
MRALLVLNEKNGNARVMVNLSKKRMESRLAFLLEGQKAREAFELLKSEAEVDAYLPAGAKLPFMPQLTLVEDLV